MGMSSDDVESNSETLVCSCSGNSDNFINCLEDHDDNSGDGVASKGSDDSACDDEDSNGDEVDDNAFGDVNADSAV